MSLVFNEQTKLLAAALNTVASSCFTVGIATPIAGYLYNVGNLQSTLAPSVLALGVSGWLLSAVLPHLLGRRLLMRLRP